MSRGTEGREEMGIRETYFIRICRMPHLLTPSRGITSTVKRSTPRSEDAMLKQDPHTPFGASAGTGIGLSGHAGSRGHFPSYPSPKPIQPTRASARRICPKEMRWPQNLAKRNQVIVDEISKDAWGLFQAGLQVHPQ